jgi:flagellar hook protein FlgE
MKAFCLTTLIGVLLIICANGIQAQPTQTQIHHIELMKQFSVRWKDAVAKDTFYPQKLKTSKGRQLKYAKGGVQKPDSTIEESWEKTTNQWVDISKEEYTYDSNGNNTLYIVYIWNDTNSQWIAKHNEKSTYDVYGNRTSNIWQVWLEFLSEWSIYRRTYYYPEQNPDIPKNNISVYPNPASEYIVFDITNISESTTVELFDNQGKKVLEQKLFVTGQISISNLAKGLYLYMINNSGNIYKGKIIVE